MSTGPINNKGGSLYFTDTGPVPNSGDYTTLVIFHGAAFTGATFQKLNSFGAASNVRVVIVNRRDYPGSTQYTDAELAELNAGKKTHLDRLGLETAYFLIWFAYNRDIPKISPDGKKGGLSVLGWSMGSVVPLAVLGHARARQNESFKALEPYFRQAILYDPPNLALGYPAIPGGYTPFTDPAFATPQSAMENFAPWVSGHYRHANISSRSVRGLDNPRVGSRPSIGNMTRSQFFDSVSLLSAIRTELPMFRVMQPAIFSQSQKALFDEVMAQDVFPRTKVIHLWCTESPWTCVHGMYETERQYQDCVRRGYKVREIRFMELERANHFVHWDDPVAFWATVVDAIHDRPVIKRTRPESFR